MHRLIIVVLLVFGCSFNQQLAGLRAMGDNLAVAAIDRASPERFGQTKDRMSGLAQQLLDFLDTGNVADLTRDQFRAALERLVPPAHRPVLDGALSAVSSRQLDVYRIGYNNVRRIRAVLTGLKTGCDEYLDSFHPGGATP